jgi:hypothetical protein
MSGTGKGPAKLPICNGDNQGQCEIHTLSQEEPAKKAEPKAETKKEKDDKEAGAGKFDTTNTSGTGKGPAN